MKGGCGCRAGLNQIGLGWVLPLRARARRRDRDRVKRRREDGKTGRRTRTRIRIGAQVQQSGVWIHDLRGSQRAECYYGRCIGLGVEMERNGERPDLCFGRMICTRKRRVHSAELNVHGVL